MREALEFGLLLLATLSGAGSLVYFLILSRLRQDRELRAYPYFLTAYTAMIGSFALLRYLFASGFLRFSAEDQAMAFASACLLGATLLGMGLLHLSDALGPVGKPSLNRYMRIMYPLFACGIVSALWLFRYYYQGDSPQLVIMLLVLAGLGPFLHMNILSMRHFPMLIKQKQSPQGFLVRGMTINLTINLILIALEFMLVPYHQMAAGGYAMPIGYLAWNSFSFVWGRRFYPLNRQLSPVAAVMPAESAVASPAGAIALSALSMAHYGLSPRERQLAELLSQGLENKEMADSLGLSVHTTRNYLAAMFKKTGAGNRVELLKILQKEPNSTFVPPKNA